MIGLIGPTDSVGQTVAVAAEHGWETRIVARPYAHVREAPTLARELDGTCQVLLFTGRVPYEFARTHDLSAELQYISHSGADLYRAIAHIALTGDGHMPATTLDSIDRATADSTFADLGLPAPAAAPLPGDVEGPMSSADELVQFHLDQMRAGRASLALTCLAEVRTRLADEGIRVERIVHTTSTLTAALHRAVLADELHRTRAAQPAVAIFHIDVDARSGLDVYDREQLRLRSQSALLQLARKNGGRLSTLDRDLYAITTSRGAIETAIERRRTGHGSMLDIPRFDVPTTVGVGIGDTYAHAEENARAAMRIEGATVAVMFPDGVVDSGDGIGHDHLGTQDVTDGYVRLGERLGIGALAARRLVRALGRIDTEAVTARELGEAYGVQTRSARRLLSTLIDAGFAEEIGIRARPQAGRPQTLCRVDLRSILEQLERPGTE